MKVLGLSEDELPGLRKGAQGKALLAWLIRRNTSVANARIAARLQMGRADCLLRYPNGIEESRDPYVVKLKERLSEITTIRDP